MAERLTPEEAKQGYEVLSGALVHLERNVLLPGLRKRAYVEQTDEFDAEIARLEAKYPDA